MTLRRLNQYREHPLGAVFLGKDDSGWIEWAILAPDDHRQPLEWEAACEEPWFSPTYAEQRQTEIDSAIEFGVYDEMGQ